MNNWKKFNEKNWDELGKIYCDTCGRKNRSDSGWYRRERIYDYNYEKTKHMLMLLYPENGAIQNKEYICDYCWKENNPNKRCCSKCKKPGHTKRKCDIIDIEEPKKINEVDE